MSLDEIRVLLRLKDAPQGDCGEVNALLDAHICHVAARIHELRRLEKQLRALRAQCTGEGDAKPCGILDELVQASSGARQGARASHAGRHVTGSHRQGSRR